MKSKLNIFVIFGIEIAMIAVLHSIYAFFGFSFSSDEGLIHYMSSIILAITIFAAWWIFLSTLTYLMISVLSPSTIRGMQGKKILSSLSFPSVRKVIDATIVATIIGSSTIAAPLLSHASDAKTVYVSEKNENSDPFSPVEEETDTSTTSTTTSPDTTDSSEEDIFGGLIDETDTTSEAPTTTTIPVEETAPKEAPSGSLTDLINGGVSNPSTTTTTAPEEDDALLPISEETPSSTTSTTVPTDVGGKTETVVPTDGTENTSTTPTTNNTSTSQYTVVAGDNFWDIASKQISNKLGRAANNQEITNYWIQLVESNRSNIKSGNPNLIYAGEIINLP